MASLSRSRDGRRSRSPTRSPTPLSRYSRSPLPSGRNGRLRDDSRSPSPRRGRSRSLSRPRGAPRSRTRSLSPPLRSTKVVVERLTKNVNEDHLYEIFGHYGEIKDLDLPISRHSGTNRGTAYILYAHEADAEAAIAHMHEAHLDGALINVSIVLPRRKFSPPPPTARRGANFDPRQPPPSFRGGPGLGGGGRGRRSPLPPPASRGPRGGPRGADIYRPRSLSRSRSRSPPPAGSSRRYRDRSASYSSRSKSRSPLPPPSRGRGRGGGRRYDDYDLADRRRSPSRGSYGSRDSVGRRSPSRSRSREWGHR